MPFFVAVSHETLESTYFAAARRGRAYLEQQVAYGDVVEAILVLLGGFTWMWCRYLLLHLERFVLWDFTRSIFTYYHVEIVWDMFMRQSLYKVVLLIVGICSRS